MSALLERGRRGAARRSGKAAVAQVSNLPYRRLLVGMAWEEREDFQLHTTCGLEIRDTAQRGEAATKMDRGCGRRPSRSALESRPCCGWCCAHSRAPKIRRGLQRFWAILINWKSAPRHRIPDRASGRGDTNCSLSNRPICSVSTYGRSRWLTRSDVEALNC